MGNKTTRWAVRHLPQLASAGEKLVLMVLAADADNDGTCPRDTSIKTVAHRAALSRSTAAQALTRLRNTGLLTAEPQTDDDGGTAANLYRLAITGVPESGTPPYRNPVHPPTENQYTSVPKSGTPRPEIGTPLTCDDATGVPKSGTPTSSIPPSEVAAAHAGTRAHTPARVHDAPAREQPPEEKTQRRRTLDHLNATAHHPDTHRLITTWTTGHATPQSRTLIDQMTKLVDGCVRGGYDTDCLAAALAAWNSRPDLGSPRALQFLYDDAVSRKNAGSDLDQPLIDDRGFPRIDPQQIPDTHLTRPVVDRVLGPDSTPAPRYPGDADHDDYTDPAEIQARRDFFAAHAETRLAERRVEVRRVLVRAWNRRGAA